MKEKQSKQSRGEYYAQVAQDALVRWEQFVSTHSKTKKKYIDRYKLREMYAGLSVRQIPELQHLLSKKLHD